MTSNYPHRFEETNLNSINKNQESILSFSSIKIKDSQNYDNLNTNIKRNKSIDPLINSANLLNSNTNKISIDNLITQSQNNINILNYNLNLSQSNERPAFSLSPSKTINIKPLLPPKTVNNKKKKTLILDLDETLVHSSFNQFNPNIPSNLILNIEFEKTQKKRYTRFNSTGCRRIFKTNE